MEGPMREPSPSQARRTGKVVAIGLDGATFRILRPLMRMGVIPNVQRLARDGVSGELTSVVPTNSASAWVSFMTGKFPARHGVFEFRSRAPGDFYRRVAVSSRHVRARTLWQMVSDCGGKAGAINVPVTYPPQEVAGFIVTGMLTPSGFGPATYPPGLAEDLRHAVEDYVIDVEWKSYDMRRVPTFLRAVEAMTNARRDAALYLMDRFSPDLLTVVFVGPDRILHPLWRFLDPASPDYEALDATHRGRVMAYFAQLDGALGSIVEAAGPCARVLIFSDHGLKPVDMQFRINDWLSQVGLLRRKRNTAAALRVLRKVDAPLRSLRRRCAPFANISGRVRGLSREASIDWASSRAYSWWDMQQGININLAGREPCGIVPPGEYEELRRWIRDELQRLVEPRTGRTVMKHVWLREEYVEGPYAHQAADIVVVPGDGFAVSRFGDRLFEPTGWPCADHELEGVLVAWGPGICEGKVLGEARLVDLCPTILYMLGMDVPPDLDGRVLTEMFEPSLVEMNRPTYAPEAEPDRAAWDLPSGLLEEEEHELRETLRGLGYL